MKNIILAIFLIFLFLIKPANAGELKPIDYSQKIVNNQIYTVKSKKLDERAELLADYLAKHNSPLQYHAQDFVDAADTYGVDWKLVPSIAGVESTFGKFIPGGHGPYISYNAWGWGVYGDQALGFNSWRDGIFTVTGGLKQNYINKGLTDPYSMNKIYAASPHWGKNVTFFLNDLDRFSKSRFYGKLAMATGAEAGSSAELKN